MVRIPTHFRGKLTKYKRFTAAMYAEFNRKPTDQEFCYYLGIGHEKLKELKQAAVLDKMGSLDVPVGESEESTLCDLVACPDCPESEMLDKVQAEQLKTVIWALVDESAWKSSESSPGKIPGRSDTERNCYQGRNHNRSS